MRRRQHDRRERLVDLEQVDVVDREPARCQHPLVAGISPSALERVGPDDGLVWMRGRADAVQGAGRPRWVVISTAALPSESGEELPGCDLPLDLVEAGLVCRVVERRFQLPASVSTVVPGRMISSVGQPVRQALELIVEPALFGCRCGLFVTSCVENSSSCCREKPHLAAIKFGADALH